MLDYRRFKEINELFAAGEDERARRLLMEVQSRSIAMKDEMDMLKIRLQSLEDALYLSKNLYEENGFLWLRTAGVRQGPFCPQCYGLDGGLIRLEKENDSLLCPYCRTSYAGHWRAPEAEREPAPGHQARILHFAR